MAVAIVWLAGFSLFFFTRPLPNLGPRFGETRTGAWLVVLDWLLPQASSSREAGIPSGWRFLPERIVLWSWAGLILAGAWGLGRTALDRLIRRNQLTGLERFVFSQGTGLSLVSLMTLGLGLGGALHRGLFITILSFGALAGVVSAVWSQRQSSSEPVTTLPKNSSRAKWLCLLAALPFLIAMLLGSVTPSTDFDVKEYHFGGPKEFYLAGRVQFLPHNVYTSFPFLTEMLTLLGMVLAGDWYFGALVGKSVLMSFIPLTGLAILAAGRRWFGEWAGWLGMLVWLSTPWAVRIVIIAYAEGGLSCYLFLAFFAVGIAVSQRPLTPKGRGDTEEPGLFFLAGFLAGSAMACKYTGLVSVVFPLGVAILYIVFRHRRSEASQKSLWLRTIGVFALGVSLAVGPWLSKNLIETGNPVYPLAWSIFGGRDWDAGLNDQWTRAHSPSDHRVMSLLVFPNGTPGWLIDVMAVNDWLSPLLYGFAPLVWLVPDHRRVGKWIWLYAGWLFFAWWCFTHRLDRFWVPMLPVIALLAGAGAVWNTGRVWKTVCSAVIGLALLFNFVLVATQNAGYIAWLSDLEKAGEFTARLTAPEIAMLNQMAKEQKLRVLSVGEAEVFDARFPIIYNTVFDRSIFQEWTESRDSDLPPADRPMRPPEEIREKLKAEGITHILVNWREILRYRTTYGYAEYVHPERFHRLVEQGILEPAVILNQARWEELSAGERDELQKSGWRERLRAPSALEELIGLAALYRVR